MKNPPVAGEKVYWMTPQGEKIYGTVGYVDLDGMVAIQDTTLCFHYKYLRGRLIKKQRRVSWIRLKKALPFEFFRSTEPKQDLHLWVKVREVKK